MYQALNKSIMLSPSFRYLDYSINNTAAKQVLLLVNDWQIASAFAKSYNEPHKTELWGSKS